MKKNKIMGVGVSLLLMGTVALGSFNLKSVAFADKVSNAKPSVETNKKEKKSIFSFNKEGKIIISTSANVNEIVNELVRIKKDSKLDIDLEELIKDRDELMSNEALTPSELADRVEDIFDEIEDIVEDIEDEIEDLKDGKKDNISQQSKKEFVREKEKIKEKYSEKRKALKEKLREEISKGNDPQKAKKEFSEGIKILELEQNKEIKELKAKYFIESKYEEKGKDKYKNNDNDDDDDDKDEDDDDED